MRHISIDDHLHDAEMTFDVLGLTVRVTSRFDNYPHESCGGSITSVAEELCPGILDDEPGNDDKLIYDMCGIPTLARLTNTRIPSVRLARMVRGAEYSRIPRPVLAKLLGIWVQYEDRVGQHVDLCQKAFEDIEVYVAHKEILLVKRHIYGVPHGAAADLITRVTAEAIQDALNLRGVK